MAKTNQRAKRKDARSIRTESVVRDALLSLLRRKSFAQITISELCREARISRPTFYDHYDGIADVLDELIAELHGLIADVPYDIMCGRENDVSPCKKVPFCELVIREGKFQPLLTDSYTATTVISRIVDLSMDALMATMASSGLSEIEIRALYIFRMNGCLASLREASLRGENWTCIRPVIDSFVSVGQAGILANDRWNHAD